jgi:signal transduction histidine kinase
VTAADTSDSPWEVARRLAAASDERRRAVERVMHDGVQQHLALLGLKLSIVQKRIGSDPGAAADLCREVHDELQWALSELRSVAHQIYPAVLENEGVGAALLGASRRLGATVDLTGADAVDVPTELRAPVYFCCLEALEVLTRLGASSAGVRVVIREEDDAYTFEVEATGTGGAEAEQGLALQHIADRLSALGGRFALWSGTSGGTTVRGAVPVGPQARR